MVLKIRNWSSLRLKLSRKFTPWYPPTRLVAVYILLFNLTTANYKRFGNFRIISSNKNFPTMTLPTKILIFLAKYTRSSTYEEDHEFGPVSSPDVEIREKKYATNANLVMEHWRSYLRTVYESAHTSSNIL